MGKISGYFVESRIIGIIKERLYQQLRKHIAFDAWHITPINFRPYAIELVSAVNHCMDHREMEKYPIVEVGCGMGDILAAIHWRWGKIGFDMSEAVIKAGKLVHPSVRFYQGSFEDVQVGNISCLIMVNFIHGIHPELLKRSVQTVLAKNRIEMVVIDTMQRIKYSDYFYSHNGEMLFGEKYKMVWRSQAFTGAQGAKRYIEFWKQV